MAVISVTLFVRFWRPCGRENVRPHTEEPNPAEQAELDRLIEEQAADDKSSGYVVQREFSLDAPLKDDPDSGSWHEVEHTPIESTPTASRPKQSYKIRPEQVREWRGLRRDGWTYAEIAGWAGVQIKTVRQHIAQRSKLKRAGVPSAKLEERLDRFRVAYEAGASLREIAQIHYADLDYKTWESCYQQLRIALKRSGVVLRWRTLKHGMRSASAPLDVRRRYDRERRERERERNRQGLTRCDAVVKSGRPCRRWAIGGSRYCMIHDERTRVEPKWTRQNVIEALQVWATTHGCPPKSHDWAKAEDGHPSFSTVVYLFGKWNFALYEAGLRKRKHPKQRKQGRVARLNKGYKSCDREGCAKTVPPTWRYCKDRRCQDLRGAKERLAA